MRPAHWLAAIGAVAASQIAMPLSGPAAPPSPAIQLSTADTLVEKAARRCWWRGGTRYCRKYAGRRLYGYRTRRAYGVHEPEAYPTGSARWWQEMDRQDRRGRRVP